MRRRVDIVDMLLLLYNSHCCKYLKLDPPIDPFYRFRIVKRLRFSSAPFGSEDSICRPMALLLLFPLIILSSLSIHSACYCFYGKKRIIRKVCLVCLLCENSRFKPNLNCSVGFIFLRMLPRSGNMLSKFS